MKKEEAVNCVRPRRGNSCWKMEMDTFSLHIQMRTLTQTFWVFFSHTLILSGHLSLLLKLTFLAGRELWSGQCVKGLPLQGRAQRKRICLAVENNTGSRVNQESSTLCTLSPAHSCNKTLCLEVEKDRTARALKLSGSRGLDQKMRRLSPRSCLQLVHIHKHTSGQRVYGVIVCACHMLLCMRALLKEPE